MKKLNLLSAVFIGGALVACGGDPKSKSAKPDNLLPPGFSLPSSSSSSTDGGSEGSSSSANSIVNQAIPYHENFDTAVDTSHFFSTAYKPLNTTNDLSFYFPTGGFLDENGNLSPTTTSWITDDENKKLQIGNGRFTIGQTKQDKVETEQDDTIPTWGELDLSKPYKISFCVVEKSGKSNLEIYIDNNTTSGNKSRYGGGNASRIVQTSLDSLSVGERFEVSVPSGAITRQIGTATSFVQFRVTSGGTLAIDDLVIEYVGEPHSFTLPECKAETTTPPTPATPPVTPTGLSAIEGDTSLVVSWASAGVGVNYQVSYNTVNDLASATSYAANPVAGNSVQLTDLVNGQQYFVWVKAVNSAGESEFSEPVSASPKAPVGGDTSKAWGFNSFEYTSILEGTSGTSNVKVSTESYDADGLVISLTNGTALRYRLDSNVWNFNGNSFRSSDSRVPAVGETVAELRAYVGVPIVVGRAAEVSFIVKQTGSGQVGKAVVVNQLNEVVLIEELTDNSTLTIALSEGHSTEELRVFYSREGAGGGGMDLLSLRKSYADSPLAEEEEPASSSSSSDSSASESSASSSSSESSVSESSSSSQQSSVSSSSSESSASESSSSAEESSSSSSSAPVGGSDVNASWESFAAADYASILSSSVDTSNNAVVQSASEHSANGLLFFHNATGTLRNRGNNPEWNFNGTGFASDDPVAVVGEAAPEMRAYIGVPVEAGRAVTLVVVHRNSGSGNTHGAMVFVGSNGTVIDKTSATANTATTSTLTLPAGHEYSQVNILFSREGGGAGGQHITSISKTYN